MIEFGFYFIPEMDKNVLWSIFHKCDALSHLYLGKLDFRIGGETTVRYPEPIHMPSLTSLQLYLASSRASYTLLSKLSAPRLLNFEFTAEDEELSESLPMGQLELPPSLSTAIFIYYAGPQFMDQTDLRIALCFNATLISPLLMKPQELGPNVKYTFSFDISSATNTDSKLPCKVKVICTDADIAIKFVNVFETQYNIKLMGSDEGCWMQEVAAIKEKLVVFRERRNGGLDIQDELALS
jgi:hypothetical protein